MIDDQTVIDLKPCKELIYIKIVNGGLFVDFDYLSCDGNLDPIEVYSNSVVVLGHCMRNTKLSNLNQGCSQQMFLGFGPIRLVRLVDQYCNEAVSWRVYLR